VVVTCRVLDYQQAKRRLADWPVETIAPLAQPLREQLITHWFTALEQLQRPTRGTPASLRDGLIRAIQARPELRRLAGNPLLLTMMIQLQAHDGELPGEQVTLYRRSVDLLLLQWRRDTAGRVALGELLELPQWSDSQLNRLLDRLAYVAHERGVSGDNEQGADLPRQVLLDTAAPFFAPYDPDRDHERAQKFLNYISAHGNGIIQRHDQQVYRFPHRTFQEYLAGRRLISDEDWPNDQPEFVDRALACSARGPQWRGALLLAVSQHALEGRLRPVFTLADELLARYRREATPHDLLLAAEILQELDRERVMQQRPALWDAIRTELGLLLQDRAAQQRPPVAVAERGRAGFLLGAFGDPRMPVTLAQWRTELDALSVPQAAGYFCRIPAGAYQIGSPADDSDAFDDEFPQHPATVTQDYWMARLPITNAQWQAWVAQGGTASRYADDDDLNQPNQPVVGLDWHAANAYCAWLSTELADVLPPGYVIRLPTEAEWEAAARGSAARRYPWGDAWCDDAAATAEDQTTRGWQWTMPVGCYPAGATPEGLLDMAGNVWEWTLSRWQAYPGAEKPFTNDKLVVVRGGAYNSNRTYVRCGARYWGRPVIRDVSLGLRVVVSPSLAQMS
ncbi:MAG: SUMF1/EgtB/PvdO family nonheme iron enzyme, partial [Oscillochloridaceae bacterium umkhey_bin13]